MGSTPFSPSTGPTFNTDCPGATVVFPPDNGFGFDILDVSGIDLRNTVQCQISVVVVANKAGQLVNLTLPALGKNSAGVTISSNSQACDVVDVGVLVLIRHS